MHLLLSECRRWGWGSHKGLTTAHLLKEGSPRTPTLGKDKHALYQESFYLSHCIFSSLEIVTHFDITCSPEVPKKEGFLCQDLHRIILSSLSVDQQPKQILVLFFKESLIIIILQQFL